MYYRFKLLAFETALRSFSQVPFRNLRFLWVLHAVAEIWPHPQCLKFFYPGLGTTSDLTLTMKELLTCPTYSMWVLPVLRNHLLLLFRLVSPFGSPNSLSKVPEINPITLPDSFIVKPPSVDSFIGAANRTS